MSATADCAGSPRSSSPKPLLPSMRLPASTSTRSRSSNTVLEHRSLADVERDAVADDRAEAALRLRRGSALTPGALRAL